MIFVQCSLIRPQARFAGRLDPKKLPEIQSLLNQALGETLGSKVRPGASCYLSARTGVKENLSFLEKLKLLGPSLRDVIRCKWVSHRLQKANPKEPFVSMQWVHVQEKICDTLALSNPCQSKSCPITKDGKPATGRATLGHDIISWTIYNA
jgi:hypothetical protein